jgi:hypothetical protein
VTDITLPVKQRFPHADPPERGNAEALALDLDFVIADIKTVVLPFLLEGRIARFMTKELLEGRRKVRKGLLIRVFMYLTDPGIACMFERIPLLLESRGRGLFTCLIVPLPFRERPVIDKARSASCTSAVRFLRLRQIEGNLVGVDHVCGPFNAACNASGNCAAHRGGH